MRLRLRELGEGGGVVERGGPELGRKEVCLWCCSIVLRWQVLCAAEKCCPAASRFSPVEDVPCLHKSSGWKQHILETLITCQATWIFMDKEAN